MSRAARVWADLGEDRRALIGALLEEFHNAGLADALDADMADLAPLWTPFLIPRDQAGPQAPARPEPRCEGCDREVGTELTAWITGDREVLLLGPSCWRERALNRAAGAEQLTLPEGGTA